jgi:hypothetical protein
MTTLFTSLLDALVSEAEQSGLNLSDWLFTGRGWQDVIADPQWENTGQVHDWRNYVSDVVVEYWDELDAHTRLILYIQGLSMASGEEWD